MSITGCKPKNLSAPLPGASLPRPAHDSESAPPVVVSENAPKRATTDVRRQIFAQIVEDSSSREYTESAILEGAPYKFFLRSLVNVTHDALRKQSNDQITFDKLMDQPGVYRGQIVTLARGVFLEVSRADPPPEYGLPAGYTILPAVFVDSARDVYALRILCPPGSTLYDKLVKTINEDSLPVARVSGYFMKLYARRTADKEEPPWRRPLLICPEPEFSQGVPPRHVQQELIESGTDKYLPSQRLDAPGAEERLVIELTRSKNEPMLADGIALKGEIKDSIPAAVKAFKSRLSAEHAAHPAAVILISAGASRKNLNDILAALRAAGVQRVAVKSEL